MIAEYPLTKANRLWLARAFRDVARMDISIPCVIEGQMGQAYVDDVEAPSAFKIQTGPFVYFAGDPLAEGGQEMLKQLKPWTFFMPSAEGWLAACQRLYGNRLLAFDRYRFSAACLSLATLQNITPAAKWSAYVKRMDLAIASRVWGRDHFVDLSEFDSAADFVARGVGYCVEGNGKILAGAYSSLVCSSAIEVSIYVAEDYRRQGMAMLLAARLIEWCLQHGIEPHWDAANLESCRLAEKLGYIPQGRYQAYCLED